MHIPQTLNRLSVRPKGAPRGTANMLLLALALVLGGCATGALDSGAEAARLHAFYYSWYGTPETDGQWLHWNHQVHLRNGQGGRHVPPEGIGASFYPEQGLYSSASVEDVGQHMAAMKAAGIGVAAVTWWGIGDRTDRTLEVAFAAAARHGMRICFHLEPFPGRNAQTTREAIVYLLDKYRDHPALYRDPRQGNRTYFYVYDSYLTPAREWAAVLDPDGENTIRTTPYDAVVIGLWVKEGDGAFMKTGHFDGFYTYFSVDGFTYGSTPSHWPAMAAWAKENGKLFVPSVGPGYDDLRIRPWNKVNQRDREGGAYYDRYFEAAIAVDPPAISITSWDEWHEGSQIAPAVPKSTGDYSYLDYKPLPADWYLTRTRYWLGQWRKGRG